jgi:hypothetical protein
MKKVWMFSKNSRMQILLLQGEEMRRTISIITSLAIAFSLSFFDTKPVFAQISGDYQFTVVDSKSIITMYRGEGGNVSLPQKLGGYTVTQIGKHAFSNCESLSSVTIPGNITTIGEGAFSFCTGLN